MLSRGFAEGEALREHGKVEVPLPDDDPAVFTILMDVIHGKSRRVPRTVRLEQLAHLAAAVDKYQLQESVEVYSDAWVAAFNNRDGTFSTTSDEKLMMWLSISWVFRKADNFAYLTSRLIHCPNWDHLKTLTKVPGTDHELPIPAPVLGAYVEPFLLPKTDFPQHKLNHVEKDRFLVSIPALKP